MKSEPDVYSIDDLDEEGVACWEGVRNYQARNFMRDEMKVGDLALFYHSNAKPPGAIGVARIVKEGYPDHHAWNKKSKYFDAKSTAENPRWFMVDVELVEKWEDVVSLAEMKEDPKLEGMLVTRKGQRLSIQPVEKPHFDRVVQLGRKKKKAG
jgi:predicted RNA-binding protein with PUA-like domain